MNIIRPTVKLHTIEEWMSLDVTLRPVILQNIKLKDRLWAWLKKEISKPRDPNDKPKWVPCRECDRKGWLLHEPRYAGIHPSQIGNECELKIFWEMIGSVGQQTHDARLQLVFDFGSAIHSVFQGYGAKGAWGPYYQKEVPIQEDLQPLANELMLEGHADADNILVLDEIPNSSAIYEVGVVHEYKSINSNGFAGLTRPKPEHKLQAMIYAAALNRPVVAYLYMNKDDSNLADFPVPFDPDIWATIYAKSKRLKQFHDNYWDAVDRKADPELPPGAAGFRCKECSYSKTCHVYEEQNRRARK